MKNLFFKHFKNSFLLFTISIMISLPYIGVLTLLKYPYPRDVAEPGEYDTIRVHAEWGDRPSSQCNSDNIQVESVSYGLWGCFF